MEKLVIIGAVAGLLLVGSCSYTYPKYKVYAAFNTASTSRKLK